MNTEANTSEWVEAFQKSHSFGWLMKMRLMFKRMAFFDLITDRSLSVVDVGCGTGDFVRTLREMGYSNARGIEYDQRLIPDDLNEYVDQGSATNLPYADNSVDVICFFNVLHHLLNVDQYLATMGEVDRCLKPGGTLVILEPDKPWFYQLTMVGAWVLSPVMSVAGLIYTEIHDERELLAYFFANAKVFKEFTSKKNYKIIRDRCFMHQWIHVVEKPMPEENRQVLKSTS